MKQILTAKQPEERVYIVKYPISIVLYATDKEDARRKAYPHFEAELKDPSRWAGMNPEVKRWVRK
jgi:hypothetical protein